MLQAIRRVMPKPRQRKASPPFAESVPIVTGVRGLSSRGLSRRNSARSASARSASAHSASARIIRSPPKPRGTPSRRKTPTVTRNNEPTVTHNEPTVTHNEPTVKQQVQIVTNNKPIQTNQPTFMFSLIKKDIMNVWSKLKTAISNRQQVTVIAAWTMREKQSQPKIIRHLEICTEQIHKLKKELIHLYSDLDDSFTQDFIKQYIDILSHVHENDYIISLEEIEYIPNCKELLNLIYSTYSNNDRHTVFIWEALTESNRNTKISNMLSDINRMSKKYSKDINAINNDNMDELFTIMKSRINGNMNKNNRNNTRKEETARRFRLRKEENAARKKAEHERALAQQAENEYTLKKQATAARLIAAQGLAQGSKIK